MTLRELELEIERLSQCRCAIWAGAPEADAGEVGRISKKLADLYEERRHAHAQLASGSNRAEIVRRARVESELERLMTR